MKLYLSSMPITSSKVLLSLVGKEDDINVSLIPNAWDTYPEERKQAEVEKFVKTFEGFGFLVHIIDLTTSNEQSLREDLKDSDIVYVMGGNTFYLNYCLHRSDFKGVVKDYLTNGLVYCGESAGAVVVGSTLHGIEYLDDSKLAPEVLWDGLKLVNFGIIPHWGWKRYGPFLEKAKMEMDRYGRVSVIENNQALVIDGEELEVVTVAE